MPAAPHEKARPPMKKAAVLAVALCALLLGGCAGKSLTLYNPQTGQKVAEYHNLDNTSEFKGLDAEFKADGSFRVHADTSSQDATAVPLAALQLANTVASKFPTTLQEVAR